MTPLTELIFEYYNARGLTFPDIWRALAFEDTEKAEVYELLLARMGGWVRNNPENKPEWNLEKLAEELGDMLMMVIVAGIAEGVDPVEALVNKIARKLELLESDASDAKALVNQVSEVGAADAS